MTPGRSIAIEVRLELRLVKNTMDRVEITSDEARVQEKPGVGISYEAAREAVERLHA